MRCSEQERFWRKVQKSDGCWLWTAGRFGNRYGAFTRCDATKAQAHRYSWELANGPIPAGLFVCHHCDNPPCVNPAHLFIGTQGDNVRDMHAKGRHRGGGWKRVGPPSTHCPAGHERKSNTRYVRGYPVCRLCRSEAQKKWRRGRKAAA